MVIVTNEIEKTVESLLIELEQAISEYLAIEEDIYNKANVVFKTSMSKGNQLSTGWRYFHILKQYIYEKLQIPLHERILLGEITYCYGALVEIADDISDGQFVWSVPFDIPLKHPRLTLATQMWMTAKVLEDCYREYRRKKKWGIRIFSEKDIGEMQRAIFDHLFKMGAEVIKYEFIKGDILPPSEIENGLINAEGGYHDQMITVIMESLRVSSPFNIASMKENFRLFGVGIEMLADASDIIENIEDGRHNYFISFIHHCGTPEEKEILKKVLQGDPEKGFDPYHAFSVSLRLVRIKAYKLILKGLWPYYSKLARLEKQRIKDFVLFYEPPLPFSEKRQSLKVEFYRQLEERLGK
ncbi:MAG: hypothetical protein HPY65_12685 [Syntrophaceae bacterium]|nr:hypothetical protein [Syntrophaceae bacterium]